MTQYALLGLGSNVEPEDHIVAMVSALSACFGHLWISSVSRTRAVGVENADDFLNVVVGIQSDMSGHTLKAWTKQQEKMLGRDHGNPMEHRRACRADMDILAFWHHDDRAVCASEFVDEPFFLPLAEEVLTLMERYDSEVGDYFFLSPRECCISLQLQDGRHFGWRPRVMESLAMIL
ncbi:MAG: 2-amino-4-hydroxy-6-hydroxymethyldihydropteridine diphosphokinase [Endozoicomonadaceae bacterium]|nr:2-amino-4-hydroxy-6-hydroxymethyldihydropteridine diphosphokinase [Endozoicomonadaceae bacterium]